MFGERDEVVRVGAPSIVAVVDQVLIADADPVARAWLRSIVAGAFVLEEVTSGSVALDRIAAGTARIVIIGTQLADMSGGDLVARAAQWLVVERRTPVTFLLADETGECAAVADHVQVHYRLLRSMQAERVRELLAQAASQLPPVPPHDPDRMLAEVVAPYVARVHAAGTDAHEVARAISEAARALVDAERARCLFCDDESGAVWSGTSEDAHDAHASQGLAGFAIRTAVGVTVPSAAADPMYRRELDDPDGTGRERLALQPVVGPDGHAHAVIVAIRDEGRVPFDAHDLARLEALAAAVAPMLMQLELQIEADAILGEQLDRGPSDMFRHEAITAMIRRGSRGDVVRVHPGWVTAAYWIVVASVIGALAFAALAQVHQYADGPAIIRYTGRNNVVAFEDGTIASVDVARGQRVERGQVLARLHDLEQAGRLRGLDTEFERRLVAYLQSPGDPNVRQALAQIVSQRESAMAGVESRVIRAPTAGVIKEVMVHNGQHVAPGTIVLSIAEPNVAEGVSVLAFLPGHERPRLHAHQMLRLTLPGYRGARIESEVRAISSEVLGANDARARYLGERLGESLPITGTVVVIEARLASPEFEADGRQFQLHDGMVGIAEVQLGARSVLETLIPGLQ